MTVTIQRAHTVIAARMRAGVAGVQGNFVEGHLLDAKTAKKVPPNFIGRPLTTSEATALLKMIE
jgi:hypothetical protein